jgi:hypothetical protein
VIAATDDTTAAEIVRAVVAVVTRGDVPHIHARHRGWLVDYLANLLETPVFDPRSERRWTLHEASHLELSTAVRAWVDEASKNDASCRNPLRPYFTVMAASMLADHYRGFGGRVVKVEAAFDTGRFVPGLDTHFAFLNDPGFKANFSRASRGVLVRGRVPRGSALLRRYERDILVDQEEEFEFEVLRCPMTEKFWTESDCVVVHDPVWDTDYFRNRAWYGRYGSDPELSGYLPYHWASELDVDEGSHDAEPRWQPIKELAQHGKR